MFQFSIEKREFMRAICKLLSGTGLNKQLQLSVCFTGVLTGDFDLRVPSVDFARGFRCADSANMRKETSVHIAVESVQIRTKSDLSSLVCSILAPVSVFQVFGKS
jgi:hypothetical protein